MTTSVSPFIIWTFRRSGGTNLGQALFRNSSFGNVEHEPFNPDRQFGQITMDWRNNKSRVNLHSDVKEILQRKINIKHCLEIVPKELNDALIEESVKQGYKHLFLYRESAKSRMLSLNYSLKTNIWGKKQIKTTPINEDEVFSELIPIDKMIKHESHCRNQMSRVYNELIKLGQEPLAVSFEQLYKSDFTYSSILVKQLFMELIGNSDSVSDVFLKKTLKGGGQGTNQDYMKFPNTDKFVGALERLPAFYLLKAGRSLNVQISKALNVRHCEFWETFPSASPQKDILSGVFLSDKNITFKDEHECQLEVISELPSDRVRKMYPDISGSGNCRFMSLPLDVKCKKILIS